MDETARALHTGDARLEHLKPRLARSNRLAAHNAVPMPAVLRLVFGLTARAANHDDARAVAATRSLSTAARSSTHREINVASPVKNSGEDTQSVTWPRDQAISKPCKSAS